MHTPGISTLRRSHLRLALLLAAAMASASAMPRAALSQTLTVTQDLTVWLRAEDIIAAATEAKNSR